MFNTQKSTIQIPFGLFQMITSFVSNYIFTFVKTLLPKWIIDILVQFASVRAKQPLGPILLFNKIIFSKFSARISARYLHSSFPKVKILV